MNHFADLYNCDDLQMISDQLFVMCPECAFYKLVYPSQL